MHRCSPVTAFDDLSQVGLIESLSELCTVVHTHFSQEVWSSPVILVVNRVTDIQNSVYCDNQLIVSHFGSIKCNTRLTTLNSSRVQSINTVGIRTVCNGTLGAESTKDGVIFETSVYFIVVDFEVNRNIGVSTTPMRTSGVTSESCVSHLYINPLLQASVLACLTASYELVKLSGLWACFKRRTTSFFTKGSQLSFELIC